MNKKILPPSTTLFDFSSTIFADLIIPRPFPNTFTYRVADDQANQIAVGSRVAVPFGRGAGQVITALVVSLHKNPPKIYEAKTILEVLDEVPSVNELQIKFFTWLSQYYMCFVGDVLQAALPSGLKINSEIKIQLNPQFFILQNDVNWQDKFEFSASEILLVDELKAREIMNYAEVSELLQTKNPFKIIHILVKKEVILTFDEIKEKYKPKIVKKVRFSYKYIYDKEALKQLIHDTEKQPKRLEIVLECMHILKPQFAKNEATNAKGILKSHFNAKFSTSALQTLISANILEEFSIIQSRLEEFGSETKALDLVHPLSEHQQKAYNEIITNFEKYNTVLLHGITGSGKTEVYIQLINRVLAQGNQVLFLLPEIALTTQIVGRLKKVFGNKIGVYHSKYSDNERVEVWKGIKNGTIEIVIGVRSSIFLPFDNLGLIIIDEEHESSYKQYDPAPRYNAKDAAIMLAHLHHAKTLLGSATPSLESYYNCKANKWQLVELLYRFSDAQLPHFELVDMKKGKLKTTVQDEFSEELLIKIKESIDNKEQVILFQNRRGYSPYICCESCGFVPDCKSCDVSLTFHIHSNEIKCHYCGHHERVPQHCPQCGSAKFKTVGFGTQKLEEDVQLKLPNARIQRMDLDTTRSKFGYQKIINAVENQEIDILVGTQMVTKGLDFEKVSLVGVFDVDRMLHFPDFRANERVFQLITQVAGRAGRKNTKGHVIIQTSQPQHPIFVKIIENNYKELYEEEIFEREKFIYPPFSRIIKIIIKDKDQTIAEDVSLALAQKLKNVLGAKRVLGPEAPIIDKIRDFYIRDIHLKIEKLNVDIAKCKTLIYTEIENLYQDKKYKSCIIYADVDPN